jgi:hypothetical protein
MRITIVNGSLGGRTGNTSRLISKIKKILLKKEESLKIKIIHLSPHFDWVKTRSAFKNSDAFIFCSGTYWDSWGSPMQLLFEKMTQIEGKKHLLGKPAAVVVTMHSVGGKELVSKMAGVLCSMGCVIPPFCGFAYSYADHVAHKSRNSEKSKKLLDDVWSIDDLSALLHNLLSYANKSFDWQVWDFLDTQALDPAYVWLK